MLNNAPRHVEQNPILEGQRARDYIRHVTNKTNCKPTMKVTAAAEDVKFQQEYKKALKQQHKTFNQNEKNIDLNRENAILLNKLVDISQGKWSSVHGPNTTKNKKLQQTQAQTSTGGPRSLNIANRRRENERIERENHAFAKRLFQNASSISKKKLDSNYNNQMALRDRISRVKKPLPNLGGRATQLPPINHSQFSTSKRSFSVKQTTPMQGRSSASKTMFTTNPKPLHQSSTSQIPINNMYDGEELERNDPVSRPPAPARPDGATIAPKAMEANFGAENEEEKYEQEQDFTMPDDDQGEEQAADQGKAEEDKEDQQDELYQESPAPQMSEKASIVQEQQQPEDQKEEQTPAAPEEPILPRDSIEDLKQPAAAEEKEVSEPHYTEPAHEEVSEKADSAPKLETEGNGRSAAAVPDENQPANDYVMDQDEDNYEDDQHDNDAKASQQNKKSVVGDEEPRKNTEGVV